MAIIILFVYFLFYCTLLVVCAKSRLFLFHLFCHKTKSENQLMIVFSYGSCLNRILKLRLLFISVAEEPESNCPITTQSKTCHVGLKNTCNEDDDCLNGTYCCFTGCRRQCWDPDTRQSFTQSKITQVSIVMINILYV